MYKIFFLYINSTGKLANRNISWRKKMYRGAQAIYGIPIRFALKISSARTTFAHEYAGKKMENVLHSITSLISGIYNVITGKVSGFFQLV